jgi:hypothetical protein
MLPDGGQAGGDFVGREYQVDRTAGDGALWHPRVLGGVLVLGKRETAGGLDLTHPQRAVRAGAGENHADRGRALHGRKRRKWSTG